MTHVVRRICLILLILYGIYTRLWGYFAPTSWYARFPGFGLNWLPPFGPYNEHFVKDVNAMYLALVTLTLATLLWMARQSMVHLTGAVWLTFNVLHLIYHSSTCTCSHRVTDSSASCR
ncbi:hypothetical protein [Saccharopolyspora sp. 5N708]|uniref:hypothetical protein n=1 Tax=Saccharopolyspora sp. 5N708 TaxID=3457424 RepID=UPI003FD646AE